MTTKKRTTPRELSPDEQTLAQILQADSGDNGITYGDIDSNTLRRLAFGLTCFLSIRTFFIYFHIYTP